MTSPLHLIELLVQVDMVLCSGRAPGGNSRIASALLKELYSEQQALREV